MSGHSKKQTIRHGRVGQLYFSPLGSQYDCVRRTLAAQGGSCSRTTLSKALAAYPQMQGRVQQDSRLAALLSNMRHSGEITLAGDTVSLTERAIKRLRQQIGEPPHEA